jgi:hypothetical protein
MTLTEFAPEHPGDTSYFIAHMLPTEWDDDEFVVHVVAGPSGSVFQVGFEIDDGGNAAYHARVQALFERKWGRPTRAPLHDQNGAVIPNDVYATDPPVEIRTDPSVFHVQIGSSVVPTH